MLIKGQIVIISVISHARRARGDGFRVRRGGFGARRGGYYY
jgi:hypothetical protein